MTATSRHLAALLAPAVVLAASSWSPALSGAPAAQQVFDAGLERQAIFPVYDGYTRNADGSLTLAFAYFSHNAAPVTIPPGPANAFSPGPADRGQPVTFLPGHHRWQCIMVVGPEFDGGLRWTLAHAGATRETSSSMLQYNWEFSERDIGSVLRGIEDPPSAPRDVCLNRPPLVRVLGYGGRRGPHELRARVGQPLKLFGSVRDEGLPRGGAPGSAWRPVSGPGDVRFGDPAQPRTTAVFDAPGTYVIELTATDSELRAATEVTVAVDPAP